MRGTEPDYITEVRRLSALNIAQTELLAAAEAIERLPGRKRRYLARHHITAMQFRHAAGAVRRAIGC